MNVQFPWMKLVYNHPSLIPISNDFFFSLTPIDLHKMKKWTIDTLRSKKIYDERSIGKFIIQ